MKHLLAYSLSGPSCSTYWKMLLAAVLLCLACSRSLLGQAAGADYTNDLPSVERVRAEIKGSDPTDTLARQVAVFTYLQAYIDRIKYNRTVRVFEPGTTPSEFVGHVTGSAIHITPKGASLAGGEMRLVGARADAPAEAEEVLPGYTNYLADADPRKWRTRVRNYRRVRYHNVYPGIDIVYYAGTSRELEFDFIIAPSADPRRIVLELSNPDLGIRLPRAYQESQTIAAIPVRRKKCVTFQIAAYDKSRPLIIDPVLTYAALFGGGGFDEARSIAVDSAGAAYIVGNTFTGNLPLVNGRAGRFSFLAKISPAGDSLVYSTYLPWAGGGAAAYAVDASGAAYMARDGAPGMPADGPSPLRECGAGAPDLYLAKLSPDGTSFVYWAASVARSQNIHRRLQWTAAVTHTSQVSRSRLISRS
jgi:hypothetical protein